MPFVYDAVIEAVVGADEALIDVFQILTYPQSLNVADCDCGPSVKNGK